MNLSAGLWFVLGVAICLIALYSIQHYPAIKRLIRERLRQTAGSTAGVREALNLPVVDFVEVPEMPGHYLILSPQPVNIANLDLQVEAEVSAIPATVMQGLASVGNLVDLGVEAAQQSGRLVLLAPESVRALRQGKPLIDASGRTMGVVHEATGKFKHVVRFTEASMVRASSIAANVVAAMAMQAQLAAIERAIRDVGREVQSVRDTQWNQIDAERLAIRDVLQSVIDVRESVGCTTEGMWSRLLPLEIAARKHVHLMTLEIESLVKRIANAKVKERRKLLNDEHAHPGRLLSAVRQMNVAQFVIGLLHCERLCELGDSAAIPMQRALAADYRNMQGQEEQLVAALLTALEHAQPSWISRTHSVWDSRAVAKRTQDLSRQILAISEEEEGPDTDTTNARHNHGSSVDQIER